MEDVGFLIPLNGLASGRTEFRWGADGKFFGSFGNTEILDADIDVSATVEKSGHDLKVDCHMSGSVTVLCDRCMDELVMPVDVEAGFDVRYGEAPQDETEDDGGERETLYVDPVESCLDMGQIVYDYVCLSLPMQRFHEDGKCNPVAMTRLKDGIRVEGTEVQGNPFSALKDVFSGD